MRNTTLRIVASLSVMTLVVMLVGTGVVGCQLSPTFISGYDVVPEKVRSTPFAASVVVSTFTDERPERHYSSMGKMFMVYIPVIPYVTLYNERIEETVQITSDKIATKGSGMTMGAVQRVAPPLSETNYPFAFAKAITKDLQASGLFQSVSHGSGGGRYHLTGTLRETPLDNNVTSYCLGMPGVLLWFLPIPIGTMSGGVVLDLTLKDSRSGATVWTYSIDERLSRLYWLYTSSALVYGRAGAFSMNVIPPLKKWGVDNRSLYGWHFAALRQGMQAAKADLNRTLSAAD